MPVKRVTNTQEFIEGALKKHGPIYDYSLVTYQKSDITVKIKCPEHGIFEQSPNSHLNGRGCPQCGILKNVRSRSYNLEKFVFAAKKVHGNRYDYSSVEYKKGSIKVKIICLRHGVFEQAPSKHLRGQGCERCARELWKYNQLTTETFIKKAIQIHGAKYDYSLVDYKGSSIKIKIVCRKHGTYEVTPNNFLRKMGGCPACAEISRADKRRLTPQEFFEKAKKIHGNKYDYYKSNYVSCFSKMKIICRKHGEFFMPPYLHLVGKGCRKCSDDKHRSNTQEFIKKAKEVHGDRFDYSLVDYIISRKTVKIICRKHGVFEQIASGHLKGNGCPYCMESRGEKKIVSFLNSYNIQYDRERSFKGCRNKYPLFFDFYIPKLNTCIEYDGLQHFIPVKYFGGQATLEQTKKSDAIKNDFCSKNDIRLIRISYKDRDFQIAQALKTALI